MARLCLCVNQVARLRNMTKDREPDPAAVAIAAELGGVDGIVAQLRDDRSDITDRDVLILKEIVQSHFNLAISLNDELVKKAIKTLPDMVTLLPSAGGEVRSESLDVPANLEYVEDVTAALRANNIVVSVLIDPDVQQIRAAARAEVDYVQFNTTMLAQVEDLSTMAEQVEKLRSVAMAANKLGLGVSAGRGLNYQNVREFEDLSFIEELNIGKAVIARSLLVGAERAVQEMKSLIS